MADQQTFNPAALSISQLKEFLRRHGLRSEAELEQLKKDPRKGVAVLLAQYRKQRESELMRKERLHKMSLREKELQNRGYDLIAGVDEAGRGPLAGPVVAAAVILDWQQEPLWEELDDSKKLAAPARERLFSLLVDGARAIAVGVVDHALIDRINIYQASLKAMRLAVRQLHPCPQYLLCDGFPVPEVEMSQEGIKGGDASCLSIAAASIVAKVIRDRIMCGFDLLYPGYGFAKHKGYPTGMHREALRLLGPSPLHRHSFRWG